MEVTIAVPREARSIEDVYREDHARLWRSLLAYCGDAAIADDAVAEAFAQALRRSAAIRDPDRWVWRAAYRIAAGALKERSKERPRAADATDPLTLLGVEIGEALAQLPDGQRAAIVLHYYADLPIPEVARVMGTTGPAIKVSLMRARRRLRTLLEEPDG
jgi:RNA polymerase sigma-70 factor, ECF subfamily